MDQPKPPSTDIGVLNWSVILLYLIAMLALGWYMSRRIKGSRGFFIAEGRLGGVLVGLSLIGTYLSALTMMALPGKSFGKQDWLWVIQLPFLILAAFVITRLVLPRFRAAGVISVYEFLEQRIHVSARTLASLGFLAISINRMGIVLFLPALAFSQITGVDIWLVIIVMGVVVTAYTAMGGIEAVVWTDAIQVVILTLGAIVSIAFIMLKVSGGGGDFWDIAAAHHKFRLWGWFDGAANESRTGTSLDITKLVSVWLILQTIFETIRIYGTQQDMTQRYMTTKSTKEANKSVWIAILGYIPLGVIFYFIGSALFVYYQVEQSPYVDSLMALKEPNYDALYPYFVVSKLPAGIGGLVLAAIFAAAMSSIDSCMNSSSTVCVEDFYKRFWAKDKDSEASDVSHLKIARWLTILWGVLAVGMAYFFSLTVTSAQDAWAIAMAFSTAGVLALMALAFLPFRIRAVPAVTGWALAALSVVVMKFGPGCFEWMPKINFLLYPVIANTLGFVVALGMNALYGPAEPLPLGALPEKGAEEALEPSDG